MAITLAVLESIQDAATNLLVYLNGYGPESDPAVVSAQIKLMQERLDRSEGIQK